MQVYIFKIMWYQAFNISPPLSRNIALLYAVFW